MARPVIPYSFSIFVLTLTHMLVHPPFHPPCHLVTTSIGRIGVYSTSRSTPVVIVITTVIASGPVRPVAQRLSRQRQLGIMVREQAWLLTLDA